MILQATAAAMAFNLVCSGDLTSEDYFSGRQVEPYSYTYRIDLERGKWCENECRALFDLASVQPTQLTLQDRNIDTPRQREWLTNIINRETGEHRILAASGTGTGRVVMDWRGRCERAEFTGFPAFPTRF